MFRKSAFLATALGIAVVGSCPVPAAAAPHGGAFGGISSIGSLNGSSAAGKAVGWNHVPGALLNPQHVPGKILNPQAGALGPNKAGTPSLSPPVVTAKPGPLPGGKAGTPGGLGLPGPAFPGTNPPPPPSNNGSNPPSAGHPSKGPWSVPPIVPVVTYPSDGSGRTVTTVTSATSPATTAPAATATEPCNCLTKQYLDDGSVLFRDICTKEAAIGTPAEFKARAMRDQ